MVGSWFLKYTVNSRVPGLALLCVTLVAIASCSLGPQERANPLDPLNPDGDPFQLTLTLVDVVVDTGTVRKIQLEWNNIDHVALDEYHVYRRLPVDLDGYVIVGVTQPPVTTFLDLESVAEDPYYFRVHAVLGGGADSAYSHELRYLGRYDARY